MNDLIVFAFGCFVSLVVLAAVGLLMWGAAQEPLPGEDFEEQQEVEPPARPRSVRTDAALPPQSVGSLPSR